MRTSVSTSWTSQPVVPARSIFDPALGCAHACRSTACSCASCWRRRSAPAPARSAARGQRKQHALPRPATLCLGNRRSATFRAGRGDDGEPAARPRPVLLWLLPLPAHPLQDPPGRSRASRGSETAGEQCRGGHAGMARRKRDPGRRLLPPHPQRRPPRRSAGTGGRAGWKGGSRLPHWLIEANAFRAACTLAGRQGSEKRPGVGGDAFPLFYALGARSPASTRLFEPAGQMAVQRGVPRPRSLRECLCCAMGLDRSA